MNTIEQTIEMAGFGKKKATKGQIDLFEKRFAAEGETLLAVGFNAKGDRQLYVTNKKIVLHEILGFLKNNEKNIPVANITSVNLETKLAVYAVLTFTTSGNTIEIDGIPLAIAREIQSIVEGLKSSDVPKSKDVGNKDTYEIAEEIRELKDLMDDGLITEEEFNAKKKQLLGI